MVFISVGTQLVTVFATLLVHHCNHLYRESISDAKCPHFLIVTLLYWSVKVASKKQEDKLKIVEHEEDILSC